MTKKLVIVESPAKSKTIAQYLGEDYSVTASVGHIRDLATTGKGGLGIDIENDFEPNYRVVKGKENLVKQLNKLTKSAEEIYLATDPDREGEAISWHLKETLKIGDKPVKRVVFNEITKEAVKNAFLNPRDINTDLVSSQETRRMLDRIIGFKLSSLLQSKIKSKSAGRVQSAALKLIVDLDKEIESFIPEEYHEIFAYFGDLETKLFKLNDKKPEIHSQKEVDEILKNMTENFVVSEISTKLNRSNPRPPLITSTLQQTSSSKFGYSSDYTLKTAQSLYEGIDIDGEQIGLITYIRTDSTRLADSFVYDARDFIKNEFGSEYLGYYPKQKKKANSQDAHEALRPTSVKRTPAMMKKYLKSNEYKVYKLIYDKALGSLMSAAINEVTTLLLENNQTIFKATSSKKIFDGYLKLTSSYDEQDQEGLGFEKFKEKQEIKADKVESKQNFTSPPSRYTEARLIKDLEELGIGRPSTYATIVSTLKRRHYVSVGKNKLFVPTEQGKLTIEKLEQFFSRLISANYTKEMEEVLDEIANGNEIQLAVLKEFYNNFIEEFNEAKKNMEKIPPKETGKACPKCGSPLVIRKSRYGEFVACSNYPKCKYIEQEEKPDKPKDFDTGVKCPKCEKGTLLVKTATKGKNKGNKFLACSGFPKCKYISPLKIVDENCPNCDNVVVQDESGKVFCIDGKECE